MKKWMLSFAMLVTAIWSIVASQRGDLMAYGVLKPLTTVLIVLIALFSPNQENKIYHKYTVIALCFCLMGDIFLLNSAYFLFGLASFLVAHLFFTYAFSTVNGFSRNFRPLIVLGMVCLSYFFYLKPGLGNLALPVFIYMAVIVTMTWQAISLYLQDLQKEYLPIAFAATLFMLSDSLLAYNKFKEPLAGADMLILATYWLAIYLFALTGYFVKNKSLLSNL